MGKYIVKRIGYMVVVLIVLSFIMFMIYNLVPSNRAFTDANNDIKTLKGNISAEERQARFEELYLQYQRRYGTDVENRVIRYLRWVGVYPLYDEIGRAHV